MATERWQVRRCYEEERIQSTTAATFSRRQPRGGTKAGCDWTGMGIIDIIVLFVLFVLILGIYDNDSD